MKSGETAHTKAIDDEIKVLRGEILDLISFKINKTLLYVYKWKNKDLRTDCPQKKLKIKLKKKIKSIIQ